jgi:hypothetical protein
MMFVYRPNVGSGSHDRISGELYNYPFNLTITEFYNLHEIEFDKSSWNEWFAHILSGQSTVRHYMLKKPAMPISA